MPQQTLDVIRTKNGKSFQIAQREGNGPVSEGSVKTVEGKEKKPTPGEMPDPHLLFYNSLLCAGLLILFAILARNRQVVPKGFANFAEYVAELMNNFTIGIVGEEGKRYTPLVGTVFLYILVMNLIGIIPGFHSPTSNLTITLALGVVVFVYVQFENIRQNGIVGYLKHFMGPLPAMSPFMFFIELISEFVRPFTLAIRLFGNIFGEDVIVVVLAGLLGSLGASYVGWLPVQLPVVFLSLITAIVQALVFASLTCIYLVLVQPHGHEDHAEAVVGH